MGPTGFTLPAADYLWSRDYDWAVHGFTIPVDPSRAAQREARFLYKLYEGSCSPSSMMPKTKKGVESVDYADVFADVAVLGLHTMTMFFTGMVETAGSDMCFARTLVARDAVVELAAKESATKAWARVHLNLASTHNVRPWERLPGGRTPVEKKTRRGSMRQRSLRKKARRLRPMEMDLRRVRRTRIEAALVEDQGMDVSD